MSQTALVTGASGGIGLDLAREFAAHGFDLILVARSADKLAANAEELRRSNVAVEVITQDLEEVGAAEKLVQQLSARKLQVDVLVNNAGYGLVGRFDQLPTDGQVGMMNLNMTSLVALTRLLLPAMIERRSGRILNVASTAAFQPGPFMAIYYATKAFVLSFSEALGEELRGTGVTVTALCPGPVKTGFAERAGATKSSLFQRRAVMASPAVARAGFAGCMAGRRVVVPGRTNWIGTKLVGLVPRGRVLKMVRGLNLSTH
ncbi:MAG: SDR family oxidoreductase [Acidobacteriales bacterium]|nr:SDR family oxidoreductase [Terriglobales bacterium]